MSYELKSSTLIDWPSQVNLPAGPATFPLIELEDVPGVLVGSDDTNQGNGPYIAGEGWQFRNTAGSTFLVVDRARPADVILLDPNLAAAIREELGLSETVLQEGVTITRPITVLDLVGLVSLTTTTVQSLAGIEYCTNLEFLDLSDSTVDNIDPLRGLIKLKKLNLRNTPISKITALLDLPSLELVNLRGTNVTSVAAANQVYDMLNGGILVLGSSDLVGIPYREFDMIVTDSWAPVPVGDQIGWTYTVIKYPLIDKYRFIFKAAVCPWELTGSAFFAEIRSGGTVVFDLVGFEDAFGFQDDIAKFIMETPDAELVAKDEFGADYLKGFFEQGETAGFIADPPEEALVPSDSNLEAAIKENMTYLVGEDIELRFTKLLQTLIAPYRGIVDITDLSDFESLKHIALAYNEITSLAYLIPLPLEYLDVAGNVAVSVQEVIPTVFGNFAHTDIHTFHTVASNLLTDFIGTRTNDYIFPTLMDGSVAPLQTIDVTHKVVSGKFVSAFVDFDGDTISKFGIYTGTDCNDLSGVIKEYTTITYAENLVTAAVSGSGDVVVEVTDHTLETGDVVQVTTAFDIPVGIFEITVADADHVTLHDAVSVTISIGYKVTKTIGLNSADFLAFPHGDFFVIWFVAGVPTYRKMFTVPAFNAELGFVAGEMNATNLPAITSATVRTITGATAGDPTTLTIVGHGLETMIYVDIVELLGIPEVNGPQLIYVIDANTIGLDGLVSTGAYVSGGKLTPTPVEYTGELTANFVHNLFLDYYFCQLRVHSTAYPIQQISLVKGSTLVRTTFDAIEQEDTLSSTSFHGDTVINQEYTVVFNLTPGEVTRFSKGLTYSGLESGWAGIFSSSYPEGVIGSDRTGFDASAVEPGEIRVKVITTYETEGFPLDDLIIKLPVIGSGPMLVGPFDSIFHATETIEGATYTDLIRLEFASDVQNGEPLTGDIKIAVMELA